jgi:hypothetical protein
MISTTQNLTNLSDRPSPSRIASLQTRKVKAMVTLRRRSYPPGGTLFSPQVATRFPPKSNKWKIGVAIEREAEARHDSITYVRLRQVVWSFR